MFDYDKLVKKLTKLPTESERKQQKIAKKMLLDADFFVWLYQPKKSNQPLTNEMVQNLYELLIKPRTIRVITDTIEDIGYREFDRIHATFLYSIANIAIEDNNTRATQVAKDRKENRISRRDAEEFEHKIEKYSDYVSDLLKCARKIVKEAVKKASEESCLHKDLCYDAFMLVPDPTYIDRFRIGFYLNAMLNVFYSDIAKMGQGSGFGSYSKTRPVSWRPFFRMVFGKEALDNVATFILLEGVKRIDQYKNSDGLDSVKDCWDSLTEFALKELNGASDATRSQMLELYLKRIDRMFKNGSYDLRVNLLDLPSNFGNLVDTVEHYADRIKEILNRNNTNTDVNEIDV